MPMTDDTMEPVMNGAQDALDDETAWTAVLARDRAFDGRFVTGVLSTGIYCRPSCAARHASSIASTRPTTNAVSSSA